MTGALGATSVVAALTWKRLVRGHSLWIAAGIALVPVAFATLLRSFELGTHRVIDYLLAVELLVLVVVPALFVTQSIGEEIEDRTVTYLWSRAVPRSAVVLGKLATLAPIAAAFSFASWQVSLTIALGEPPSVQSSLALAAGAVAVSSIAMGISVLAPRHGMALAIGYMVADAWFGWIPASIKNISVTHNAQALSGSGATATAALWICGVAAAWLAVALFQIRRIEA